MQRSNRQMGFTLIELLVVVAIIGLLLAILLPSLAKARAQSRAAVCGTRLRTLAQAWNVYAGEARDKLLPGRLPPFEPGSFSNPLNHYRISTGRKYRPRWPAILQPQVGTPAIAAPQTDRDRQNYVSEAYYCPDAVWPDERNAAYGYNYQFLGNTRDNGRNVERNAKVSLTRIARPADTVIVADSAGTAAAFAMNARLEYENNGRDEAASGNAGWALDPPRMTGGSSRASGVSRSAPDTRHADKANTAFADGHVSAMRLSKLGYSVAEDGRVRNSGNNATNRLFSGTGDDRTPP
ncbi:MAG: prepilin-type N-terminal cleavage/methylation domain-containing protein [Phycisphaerae bacterium]